MNDEYMKIAEIFRWDITSNIDGLAVRTYTYVLGRTLEEVKAFTRLMFKIFMIWVFTHICRCKPSHLMI